MTGDDVAAARAELHRLLAEEASTPRNRCAVTGPRRATGTVTDGGSTPTHATSMPSWADRPLWQRQLAACGLTLLIAICVVTIAICTTAAIHTLRGH